MNPEHPSSPLEPPVDAPEKHASIAYDARLRKWVTWSGVIGNSILAACFFGFIIYQSIWGASDPSNWLLKVIKTHYAAIGGTPMSAVTAFGIVSLLKVTSGPIEFEALGFKFRGASGPIVLWVVCFLSIVAAFHLLWPDVG